MPASKREKDAVAIREDVNGGIKVLLRCAVSDSGARTGTFVGSDVYILRVSESDQGRSQLFDVAVNHCKS